MAISNADLDLYVALGGIAVVGWIVYQVIQEAEQAATDAVDEVESIPAALGNSAESAVDDVTGFLTFGYYTPFAPTEQPTSPPQ